MNYKKLSAPTLKELFVKELENMILSGKLEIGSQLPPERELAESMGVSRAVVNGGIIEAANKGFLRVKPRVGAFVEDYRRYGSLETLISIMNYNGGILRHREIKSILELRLSNDSLALQLLMERVTAEDMETLGNLIALVKSAEKSPEETAQAVFNFLHEIYVLSGNTLLPLIAHSFKVPTIHLWERFGRLYGTELIYRDVEKYMSFIKSKDLDGGLEHVKAVLSGIIEGEYQIYSE